MEHVAEVLGALVGDFDRDVIGMGSECAVQTDLLARCEALPPGAENMTDPVERLALAAAMPESLLLDPPAHVIDRCAGELDDVEGVQTSRDRPSRTDLGRGRAASQWGGFLGSGPPSR